MQPEIGKYIIFIGFVILIVGVFIYFFGNKLNWVGNLPGDFRVNKPNFKFYFPLTTMLIFSVVLNVIIYIIRKLFM